MNRGKIADFCPPAGRSGQAGNPAIRFFKQPQHQTLHNLPGPVRPSISKGPTPNSENQAFRPADDTCFHKVLAHGNQQFWNIDFHRAGFEAGTAQARRHGQVLMCLQAVKQRSQQGTNRAGIDASIAFSADFPVNRTGVQAGTAPDAAQCIAVFAG